MGSDCYTDIESLGGVAAVCGHVGNLETAWLAFGARVAGQAERLGEDRSDGEVVRFRRLIFCVDPGTVVLPHSVRSARQQGGRRAA